MYIILLDEERSVDFRHQQQESPADKIVIPGSPSLAGQGNANKLLRFSSSRQKASFSFWGIFTPNGFEKLLWEKQQLGVDQETCRCVDCQSGISQRSRWQNVHYFRFRIVKFNVPDNDFAPIKEVTC